ncbi:MAG TPA: alanine--tRNA ligase [Bacilli bacterium]|nr:alanine--tRNA ligase [Bacilli bacterium]
MDKLSSSEIRRIFIDYFVNKDHMYIESASLVPSDDKSLLWNNAGITPLKKYFDGTLKPPYKRLVNCQKCIRTNDIENVGKTSRHQTFFEMLGNFSIGDYFKKDAIAMAYELLTSNKYYNLDKEKLYITIHTKDLESKKEWINQGINEDKIIMLDSNFWQIGKGPSGFDSEIFYDKGSKYDKDNLGIELLKKEIDNDRYIEIWNIVFSEYNYEEGVDISKLEVLPNKNIDTGLGLERLVSIIQDTETNYETDLFMPIIEEIEKITNKKYIDNKFNFRVIADHIRTIVFALSDNANFSNEGRGYVLRRLLRRASRSSMKLGCTKPMLFNLVEVVINTMKNVYPNIINNIDKSKGLIKKEEEMFLKTLSSGEKKLKQFIDNRNITGEDVFKLYDTYGFPYELTEEILMENNISINREDFDKCMRKQKELSKKNINNLSSMTSQGEIINFKDSSKFIYDKYKLKTKVIGLIKDNKMVEYLDTDGYVILEETPFYASLGGQTCDTGIINKLGLNANVVDVQKSLNDQNIHKVLITKGKIKLGDIITAKIDIERRNSISKNHTATHILQKCLQIVLGNEVKQSGSSVDDNKLRFDFYYSKSIDDNKLIEVEDLVNKYIKEGYKTNIKTMSLDKAKSLGAQALFTEKYKDEVRVVTINDSIELCGGTHVSNTNSINKFVILNCESKGLNIYRIEAATDKNVYKEAFLAIKPYNDDMKLLLLKVKKIITQASKKGIKLDVNINISNERPDSYKDIVENKMELIKIKAEVQDLDKRYIDKLTNYEINNAKKLLDKVVENKNGKVLVTKTSDVETDILKSVVQSLLNNMGTGVVFIINILDNNINIIGKKSEDYNKDINIGEVIKEASNMISGNGGGNALFGQGGGTNINKVDEVIKYINESIE